MRARDIVIGLIILAIVAGAIVWFRRPKTPEPTPTPSVEEKLEETFRFQIPEDVERAELRDVSGGEGIGIATRDMVLADLPEPAATDAYQVWMDGKFLGTMRVAKGGYLFEEKMTGKKIEVKLGDKTILEGSF